MHANIDSVEVTGDCCFEIEANNGDYETVDPEFPSDITTFFNMTILYQPYKIYVYNRWRIQDNTCKH